jgi:hypothetical protein
MVVKNMIVLGAIYHATRQWFIAWLHQWLHQWLHS